MSRQKNGYYRVSIYKKLCETYCEKELYIYSWRKFVSAKLQKMSFWISHKETLFKT